VRTQIQLVSEAAECPWRSSLHDWRLKVVCHNRMAAQRAAASGDERGRPRSPASQPYARGQIRRVPKDPAAYQPSCATSTLVRVSAMISCVRRLGW
jgi:hypothetical protein